MTRSLRLSMLLLAVLAGSLPTAARAWWNTSWNYRVPILMSAPPSAQSNYLLEVMLTASQVSGYNWSGLDADLRLIDQDDLTQLKFFVQPRRAATQVVRLWVLVPSLPAASRTIYLYYGNASATSASSGATALASAPGGVRLWTRLYNGAALSSQSGWYSSFNAGNDTTPGYSCSVPATFQGQNNQSMASGSSSSIAWNVTSIINVPAGQAGSWSLRWGPDLGLGGGVYIDDVPLQENWGADLWWGGSWSNSAQVLQGSVTLSAGYHVVRGVGDENCCDGGQEIDAMPPGGAWTALGTAGFALKAPNCQVSLATPQPVQTAADHFAVTTAGGAVNCQPAPVTITAHTAAHAALATTDKITLATSTGHGDWSLSSGSGVFTAGASNGGTATYAYSSADGGVVSLALRDTYAETVTISVTDGAVTATSGTASAAEDAPLTFAPSGFRFTNGANAAAAIGTQIAGVTSSQNLALQAIRTDTSTGACTAVFASGATVNVSLAYQCNNPTTCVAGQSLVLTNNGVTTGLASNPATGIATYTTVPLKFSTNNAEAPLTLKYTDAGQITLSARYVIPLGSGAGSGNTMQGAGQFVVQPYALTLSNIKRTSDGLANPAASTATGTVFVGAGQAFSATVTASNAQGVATPNFGQEISPAAVSLNSGLVLPAGGHNATVSGTFANYGGGSATGTTFGWPEAGIITLTPAVANYLSSGAITGTATGNVGRFVPNNFAAALNTPVFGTACASGSFTYVGQPFTYTVAPVITLTAQALGGATTQNYTGSLMRLSNTSLTGRSYNPTPASPALNLTGLPAASGDPVIGDVGGGQVKLTFGAGSGLSFTRGAAIAPFNANIALSQNVIDLDGVAAPNPVTFGSGTGIAFSTGASQVYGRLAIRNAAGSELLDLPVPLVAQSYLGTANGFATNAADNCSAAPVLGFSAYQLNLSAGKTCVRDSGSPGASGLGCAAAATGSRYAATAVNGSFNLNLAAPGSGDNGAVTVTASTVPWLQYLWNASAGVNANPAGVATFGVFPGPPSRVYEREVY